MLIALGVSGFAAAFACSAWVPRPLLFEIGLGAWPLWRLATDGVALTFDDGPDPASTPRLLDVLARCRVCATFFVSTARAMQYPELVRQARGAGHAIGCHGMTHRQLAFRSGRLLAREVGDAINGLEDILGEPVHLFRPPYGMRCPRLYAALRRAGVRPVFWSVMAYDWRMPPAQKISDRVIRGAQPGAVVLLHDGGGDRGATVSAVPLIVDALESRIEFVSPAGLPPWRMIAA